MIKKATGNKFPENVKNSEILLRWPKMAHFGQRLGGLIKLSGFTKETIAPVVRMSPKRIEQLVTSKTCRLQAVNMLALCGVFGVTPEWFCTGEGSPLPWLPAKYSDDELLKLVRAMDTDVRDWLMDVAAITNRRHLGK